jgi:hypothetical protein
LFPTIVKPEVPLRVTVLAGLIWPWLVNIVRVPLLRVMPPAGMTTFEATSEPMSVLGLMRFTVPWLMTVPPV